ncbi:MAG: Gfo/Idh/MocA family oxidoreductase [Balneolaceae bacterium]|nr:Gfo/Idh/MocA family oxidoreductase [Balneolaceae bacterium]
MKWILYLTGITLILITSQTAIYAQSDEPGPVTMAMAGLSHGHSHWIFQDAFASEVHLTGIYEPNRELVDQFINHYDLNADLFYDDLEMMLDELQPEGLLAFGPIYNHLAAVEAAAPRGIHVMVEKPLAVSIEHAEKMKSLADEHGIHVLTNYETSWYPGTVKTHRLLTQNPEDFGEVRKALFYHGHQGPKEIGVGPEFLEWLIDPKLNGGGALVDFGCYGANIMTWLTGGEKPVSVTAVTRTYKPEIYSKVDDDATIIVTYAGAQAIIQASWNWPFNRKDMKIYGEKGFIESPQPGMVHIRKQGESDERIETVTAGDVELETDPFHYFASVIRGNIEMEPYSLYSMENNMRVVQILDAAKKSAATGETVYFD